MGNRRIGGSLHLLDEKEHVVKEKFSGENDTSFELGSLIGISAQERMKEVGLQAVPRILNGKWRTAFVSGAITVSRYV
jgi:hypothetical protein